MPTSSPTLPDIKKLESIAQKAGEILIEGFSRSNIQINFKGERDPVTEIDLRIQEFLYHELKTLLPGSNFLAEEENTESSSSLTKDSFTWIVDPLDGTVNFTHGIPLVAISIALAHGDELLQGIVYAPAQREYYFAQKDHGAFLNGKKISVTNQKDPASSIFCTGFSYSINQDRDNNLERFCRITKKAMATRRLGSAALDLAYVAAGRFDGFWELNLNPWDVAAGALLVKEAGGTLTDGAGGTQYLFGKSIIACNPNLFEFLLKELEY